MSGICVVPEGRHGEWSIERRSVDEDGAETDAAVAAIFGDARPTVTPGEYTVLCRDGVVWMSDSEPELADHDEVLRQVRQRGGRVLVHGLGLGLILRQMLAFDNVEHVDVVELEEAVIALVAPSVEEFVQAGRLTIHHASCLTKQWPADVRWSVAWHDIWPDIVEANLPDMRLLRSVFAGRCDWQACWGDGLLTGSEQGDSPRPGEQWVHKATGRAVRVLFCVGAGPFGAPRQVQWSDENGQGKDSMPSFLDRFERAG
jgi:hypothetical protein